MNTKAIITAMKEEADTIITTFWLVETKKLKNIKIFEWNKNDTKIILVLAGIGKIQAAMATTFLLENYTIDTLINIGIAGNTAGWELKIGDVVLPTSFVQQDMYLPFDGEHLDYAKKPIFIKNFDEKIATEKFSTILGGVCVTWDEFVDNDERIIFLKDTFDAKVCEMEAFAILSVAREYDMLDRCIVIKAISDGADNEAKDVHMNNLEFAMKNSIEVLNFVL